MIEYTVVWRIELSAENPQDAANKALEMQRDPSSLAVHFEVSDNDRWDKEHINIEGEI